MEHRDGDRERLRAISHPARLRMLSSLALSGKSATQLAREMGMSQPAASYHVRTLAEAGLITHIDTRHVRGGCEKVFAVTSSGIGSGHGGPPAGAVEAAVDALQRLIA